MRLGVGGTPIRSEVAQDSLGFSKIFSGTFHDSLGTPRHSKGISKILQEYPPDILGYLKIFWGTPRCSEVPQDVLGVPQDILEEGYPRCSGVSQDILRISQTVLWDIPGISGYPRFSKVSQFILGGFQDSLENSKTF